MRVALITRYFDSTNAGIGRVSAELLKGLLNRDHEVIPICTTKQSLPEYMSYSTLDLWMRMPDYADVYHAVTPVESLWMPKTKAITTILDLIPLLNPDKCGAGIGYNSILNKIGTSYFGYCAKSAARNSRFVTTIAESTKQEICDTFKVSPDKVKVIRPGIRSDLKPDFFQFMKGRTFGYLGQLDRRKRVDVLITSFIQSACADSKLLIAGCGRDSNKLRALANNDSRIAFLGFVDDDELCGFYNSLDFFIFPTWAEGYGLPIVEAAACGTPIITLDDACIPSDVKEHTISLNSLDLLFENPEWFEPTEIELLKNVAWAKTHSWDAYVEAHIRLYKEVANG
jgi:glycosyltransferase involved in cell wall biosynthesis